MPPRPTTTVPNPAFYADEEVREAVADHFTAFAAIGPERIPQLWAALPEEYGYAIPEQGAWIIVKEVPHTELTGVFDVPLYSIWRARATHHQTTLKLRLPRKTTFKWPLLRAVINTPEGELTLLPGEYVPVKDMAVWLDLIGKGVSMNFIGAGEPGELAEQMFYLQSRGIRRRDALTLLLPSLTDQDFAYLTIDPGALA